MHANLAKTAVVLRTHIHHVLALFVVFIWSVPMLLTRSQIEWGDFSYFAQLYEAIKLSIVNYHQFPWWNPWMAGGIPLYANPQAGVLSITTVLALFFSTPIALKLTVVIFYILGYLSIVWLLRYFKVTGPMASLLGLVWVFNGFFVAHLPAHFTFIWFLVAPAFIRLALSIRDRRSGLLLGAALAAMALGQMHYSFVMISILVAVTILVRLAVERRECFAILLASMWAGGLFVLLAGHRVLLTLQDASSFPRQAFDPASKFVEDMFSFFVPYSYNYGVEPALKPFYGWNEQTAYPSIFVISALIISLIAYFGRKGSFRLPVLIRKPGLPATILLFILATLVVGIGGRHWFAPYNWLKLLPVLSQMRISARWFIFTDLGILVFIGFMYARNKLETLYKHFVLTFVGLAVVELFVLNFGYQAKILNHVIVRPPQGVSTSQLTFGQDIRFGETHTSPDGLPIPEANKQYLYREYESTLFNIGTILANEVFVNLYDNDTPRCSYGAGCGLVLSHNADVVKWTPDQIIFSRTAPGRIELDVNPGSYISVNGKRLDIKQVAALHDRFYLPVSDDERVITLTYSPKMF